jgi:glutamate/tyrosine decarboxylase-like PLP-dependent enzyme
LDSKEFCKIWESLGEDIRHYYSAVSHLPVNPKPSQVQIQEFLNDWNFSSPKSPEFIKTEFFESLAKWQLHVAHPNYHGVFNPRPLAMGVLAEAMVAAFNPQLASSESSVLGVMLEKKLLDFFSNRFQLPVESEGMFTSGGTEANLMALLQALQFKYPDYKKQGVKSIKDDLRIYVSDETHHSILRAVLVTGLGMDSVVEIKTDIRGTIDVEQLLSQIENDKNKGLMPFMIVGTAGTTSAGSFDPLAKLADIARTEHCWFHVDAAWGGAAVLLPEYQEYFSGSSEADSITLDAHKWLSVPMGCGLFLSRHQGLLRKTFQVEVSYYMPKNSEKSELPQPYAMSTQWSRRLMGLKLFFTLSHLGVNGYADLLRAQIEIGDYLREKILEQGWKILNDTPFPVVCFNRNKNEDLEALAENLALNGSAWITTTKLQNHAEKVLRVGIPNYVTTKKDIDKLISNLKKF